MNAGELLRQNLKQILERWEHCVRSEIETASRQHPITLRDHLPPFLEALCSTLSEPHDDDHADYQVDMSKVHGETRADLYDYDLNDILEEYSLLRRVIIAFFYEHGIEDRTNHRIVHRSLDLAMATAGQQFMDDRKRKLETALAHQKELNTELDKFVAVAAHDLRSPIATMIGFLELARENSNAPKFDEKALSIARRSLKMIESLLHRAKIRNGVLDRSEFQICDLVTELKTALQSEIEEKSAVIECTSRLFISADRTAISQLIQNLIANSLKFAQDGVAPRIEISAESTEEGAVAVHVKDNGIGIAEDSREEIFKAFHREGEKSGALGLGLGLDTCRKIAEAHDGSLVVAPSDEGAHFVLTLPTQG